MVCRLESPDARTRLEIVRHKAAQIAGRFADEALEFIADRFKNNVRELEGALNCLQAYHRMTSKRITVSIAKRVLADLQRDCLRVIRIADVEKVVCELFGVDAQQIQSAERSRSISNRACWRCTWPANTRRPPIVKLADTSADEITAR